MLSRRNASMIIGISMGHETCRILGQVSHNLLYSKKKLLTDICGPGGDWRETAYIQARSSMARALEINRKACQAEGEASGLKKRFILRTHENCVESISSTPEDTEFKETIKNARKKLETSVAPAMPCKILKKILGVVHPTKFRRNWRVFWKLLNPQECVWEIRYRIIMKTIMQEKVKIHYSITIWFTNLFLCLKLWKFLQQKQWWTRNGKNWRNFRRGTWQKSEVRKKW